MDRDDSTTALVDNWTLDLAFLAIRGSEGRAPAARRPPETRRTDDAAIRALLQLLDALVLHDRLLHNERADQGWARSAELEPIAPFLVGVEVPRDPRPGKASTPPGAAGEQDAGAGWRSWRRHHLVVERSMEYLDFARRIGVAYWPSPERRDFVESAFGPPADMGFLVPLRTAVDASLATMLAEVLELVGERSALEFGGFGSAVLSACQSRADILPAVIELRESKPARGLRAWLVAMNVALATKDGHAVAEAFRDLEDVVHDVRRRLGLDEPRGTVQWTIGLSPRLQLDDSALREARRRYATRGKLHLTFLRRHLDRVLRSPDLQGHLVRLFRSS